MCIIAIPINAVSLIEGLIEGRDVRLQGLMTESAIGRHLVGRQVGAGVDPVLSLFGADVILVGHGDHLVVRRDRTVNSKSNASVKPDTEMIFVLCVCVFVYVIKTKVRQNHIVFHFCKLTA